METYTIFEAAHRFGAEVIKRLESLEHKPVKNMVGGRGYDFFNEFETDEISIEKVGRLSLHVFEPKNGAPCREYVQLKKD